MNARSSELRDDAVTERRAFLRTVGARLLPRLRVPAPGGELPIVVVADVDRLMPHARGVLGAAAALGAPVSAGALEAACALADPERIQRVLDRACLADVHINPEMRVRVARGPARPVLRAMAWSAFLVKVRNESGTTAALRAADAGGRPDAAGWLEVRMVDVPPLSPTLSGADVEYRIVRLRPREAGSREASLTFDVGQGTQDIGFRNEVPVLFDCLPSP